MDTYNQLYEEQFISSLFCIHERPGAFLGTPSLIKLLDFTAGYAFAVYKLTGYHLTFERRFRQYLLEKYHISEFPCSLSEFFTQGKSDKEGFEAFFHELKLFCQANNHPQNSESPRIPKDS